MDKLQLLRKQNQIKRQNFNQIREFLSIHTRIISETIPNTQQTMQLQSKLLNNLNKQLQSYPQALVDYQIRLQKDFELRDTLKQCQDKILFLTEMKVEKQAQFDQKTKFYGYYCKFNKQDFIPIQENELIKLFKNCNSLNKQLQKLSQNQNSSKILKMVQSSLNKGHETQDRKRTKYLKEQAVKSRDALQSKIIIMLEQQIKKQKTLIHQSELLMKQLAQLNKIHQEESLKYISKDK